MDDQMLEVVSEICTVEAEGDGPLAQLFDLVLVGDVTSLHLAADAGRGPRADPRARRDEGRLGIGALSR